MMAPYWLLLASLVALPWSCAMNSAPGQIESPVVQTQGENRWTLVPSVLAEDLEHPWGMDWITEDTMLITERVGRLQRYSLAQNSKVEIQGLPEIFVSGQGGLLDVVVHPDFAQNQQVYFSYAQGDRNQNRTTVARATLEGDRLTNWQVIFQVADPKQGTQHFGSRLLWLPDQTLLVAIGDGGNPPLSFAGGLIREQAQNLETHFGKVIRINQDGSVPVDNPFLAASGGQPEVWSYGHRNIQGLALDPNTNTVWATEHGARGGDELNLLQMGKNYGWPKVSHSREYSGDRKVADATQGPGFVDPKVVWTPSIAPSGLAIYRGDRYPGWDGQLFAGALVNQSIVRLSVDDQGEVTQEAEIPMGQRVRDVKQGPDGYLYVLTDSPEGRLLRLGVKAAS